jgi:phosphoribosylformylglycinamidine synthase
VLHPLQGSRLLYIDFSKDEFKLGGSSLAQVLNLLGDETPTINDAIYFAKAFESIQQLIRKDLVLAGHDISEGGMITTLLEMCFAVPAIGLNVDVSKLGDDIVKILFSENPGVIIQIKDEHAVTSLLKQNKINYKVIGELKNERTLTVTSKNEKPETFNIDELRDTWFKTSYQLDSRQRPKKFAESRFNNYKNQILDYQFPNGFDGRFETFHIDPSRRKPTGLRAAIIREKGVNGDREMAFTLYLAGFDVKDVHMTDLVSGREDLSDVSLIVFVGGFSNSDVLGSAKGWAGAFLFNPKAKETLDKFYQRKDTLSLGVCNGCQLMMELGLLYPEWKDHPKMHHNASGKFESIFLNLTIPENNTVMFKSLAGARLGAWVAHGEGRFILPEDKSLFRIAAQYFYQQYPGTPSGSDYSVAALSSKDGRHLAIMPHIERSLFPWNWGYYPTNRKNDTISPWIEAFVNAREWVKAQV